MNLISNETEWHWHGCNVDTPAALHLSSYCNASDRLMTPSTVIIRSEPNALRNSRADFTLHSFCLAKDVATQVVRNKNTKILFILLKISKPCEKP